MNMINMARIWFELGRIEGLVAGSGSNVVKAVEDSVDTIFEIVDKEFVGETNFLQKTEVDT